MANLKEGNLVYVTAAQKDGDTHAVAFGRVIKIEGDFITVSIAKSDVEIVTETFAPLEQLG